jgi:hypothetical protein
MRNLFILLFAVFCTKVNAQAPVWEWAQGIGGSDSESEPAVASDKDGNVFLSGNFFSTTLTFGSTTLTNDSAGIPDMFLVKMDNSSNVLWATSAGGNDQDRAFSVEVDADGNCYVAGSFKSPSITFGTTTLTNASSGYDCFIVKYDADGNVLWAMRAGGGSNDFPKHIVADASGIYIAGYYYSPTITFGSVTLTNTGSPDLFVVKLDTSGNGLWGQSVNGGTFGSEIPVSFVSDGAGNCYVACRASYGTSVIAGTDTFTYGAKGCGLVIKYNTAGNLSWSTQLDPAAWVYPAGLAVDVADNTLYLTGTFGDTSFTFAGTTLSNPITEPKVFLAKFAGDGNELWAKSVTSDHDEVGIASVVVDATGNCFVMGSFATYPIAIGSDTFQNAGEDDIYMAKLNSNGDVLWAESIGGVDYESPVFITADAHGNIYATGQYRSTSLDFGTASVSSAGMGDIFLAKLAPGTTGINAAESNNEIRIFPNPTSGEFYVQGTKFNADDEVKIFNLLGKEVYFTQIPASTSNIRIQISNMVTGVHFVRVETENQIRIERLIIQH